MIPLTRDRLPIAGRWTMLRTSDTIESSMGDDVEDEPSSAHCRLTDEDDARVFSLFFYFNFSHIIYTPSIHFFELSNVVFFLIR